MISQGPHHPPHAKIGYWCIFTTIFVFHGFASFSTRLGIFPGHHSVCYNARYFDSHVRVSAHPAMVIVKFYRRFCFPVFFTFLMVLCHNFWSALAGFILDAKPHFSGGVARWSSMWRGHFLRRYWWSEKQANLFVVYINILKCPYFTTL